MAASTAVPPAESTWYPASVARGLAAATANSGKDHPGFSTYPVAISGCSGTA
jgi:hypothetical protein